MLPKKKKKKVAQPFLPPVSLQLYVLLLLSCAAVGTCALQEAHRGRGGGPHAGTGMVPPSPDPAPRHLPRDLPWAGAPRGLVLVLTEHTGRAGESAACGTDALLQSSFTGEKKVNNTRAVSRQDG